MKAKSNPKVNTEQLKEFWDPSQSIKRNYTDLGLAYDPNLTIGIPKTKQRLMPEIMDIQEAKSINQKQNDNNETPAMRKLIETANKKQEKVYNVNENDILSCIYYIEKYGEDYEKMAKDYKNVYQDTAAQIRKRISLFKKMKFQYQKYLNEKKAGKDFLKELDDNI